MFFDRNFTFVAILIKRARAPRARVVSGRSTQLTWAHAGWLGGGGAPLVPLYLANAVFAFFSISDFFIRRLTEADPSGTPAFSTSWWVRKHCVAASAVPQRGATYWHFALPRYRMQS